MENVISLAVHRKPVEEPKPVDVNNPTLVLREMKAFLAECVCPKCSDGYMKAKPLNEAMEIWKTWPNGQINTHPHTCSSCGHAENYPIQYPALQYKYADE